MATTTRKPDKTKLSSLLEPNIDLTHPGSRHAWCHEQNKPEFAEEEKNCHLCQLRRFKSRVENNVSTAIVNSTGDGTWIPENFKFIDERVFSLDVEQGGSEWQTGCKCKERGIDCAKDGCDCLEDIDDSTIINPKFKNAYYSDGKEKGLLRLELLDTSNDEIYECSHLCDCSKEDCPNRVVSRGRKIDLEIFKTNDGRGWGVCAREDIRQGQFIDKYVGEVITPAEANRRRQEYTLKHGAKDLYLFALDKFTNKDSNDARLREDPFEVDGEFMGGPTRFINHSCDPNLRIMAVVTDRSNKQLHELCFFALRDITRGTELTFDYAAQTGTQDDGKELKDRRDKGMFTTKCLCGAENCRGWLWI